MRYLDAAGVRQLKKLNDAAYVGKEEYNDDTMVISAALNDLNGRVTTAESEIAGFSGGDENIIETVKVNGTALTVTDKAVDVTVPTTLASLTDDSTHRLVTDTEKTKLQGIAAGAEVNVQSDWSVTDSTSDAYIVNKPTIPTKVSDLTNDSGFITDAGVTSFNGSTGAITYTPPVTSVNGNTGAVTVSVPTKVSDLTNDSGFITGYTETDPVYSASAAAGITSSDISNWNGKQDALVSGSNIKTVNNESLLGSGNISVAGTPGEPGTDGVGISSVVQTTESTVSGGTNVITITKTDGTSSTFNVRNGDAVGSATIVQTTGDSTTSVMSQDATTTTISETKQHTLKVSPNSVFADNHKNGKIYSKRVFAFADIRNATAISRAVAYGSESIVNHYEAYGLLGFYQSSTTFLQVYIQGGNIKVQLQVNGTMAHNEDIGTVYNTGINSYGDYAVVFDHDDLVFRIFGYSNGSVTQLVQYSISTWDLSSLSNVYLITSIDNYQGRVCCTTLLINSPSLLNNYIAAPLNVGEFNTPQGTPFKSDLYLAGTGLNVTGTVVQTISDTDIIYSISKSSVDYWRVGPSNVVNNSPYMWHHVKLRFSSLSDGAYLQGGIAFARIAIEANSLPSGLILVQADKFYPVVDTDYDLYVQYNSDNKTGAVQYAVKLYGTVTVEVSEPYCFNDQVQNLCAETYDGDGFTGAIPCKCDPVSLVDYKIALTNAPTNIRIPTYAKRVDSNGRIYMWNGSVWKQINNS